MKPRRTNNQMTGTPQIQRSGLAVWCKAHRRPQFFMWNIMLVMVFICSLSFATFAVDVDSPQGRLVPSFTLVLTMITFKYTVNQSLPKISYLTYLDRYILCSMVMLCTVAIWHASVSAVVDTWSVGTARTADRCVIVTVACLYIVFHIVFFFIIFCRTRQHKLSAEEKHIQYQENLAKVLNLPSPHFDLTGRGWRTFSNRVGAESMS